MRKIDIEKSRDSYKECLNSALHCMVQMAKWYEKRDKHFIKRINELTEKLQSKGRIRNKNH